MRSAARAPLSGLAAFAIVPVLFHVVIVETRHARLGLAPSVPGLFKTGFVAASAVSHWGIYASLLATFALTLRPGREPLITALARRMHGDIPDEMVRYTGRVTLAWCCFFGFQLIVSVTLFCFAPLVAWSTFVNLLDIPMVAAMFGAEYFCRLRCLRDPPRYSLAAMLNMIADPAGNRGGRQPASAAMAASER